MKNIKTIITIGFIIISFNSFSQRHAEQLPYDYTVIDSSVSLDNHAVSKSNFYWGSDLKYAVDIFAGVWQESVRNRKESEMYDREEEHSIEKLAAIKTQYNGYTSYPDSITEGWHNVIVTDNVNFCKNAKVLVKDNKVQDFVIDDWIHVPVLSMGSQHIKKGFITLSMQDFNGEQLAIMDTYFVYDLDAPAITTTPSQPGYICFWSNESRYYQIIIKVEDERLDNLTQQYENEPPCFSKGMVCRMYKPGVYNFIALGRGSKKWRGAFRIKSGMCTRYKLGD
ncbi:MAG TPA: hypothetical protein VK705_12025 [Ferruginibacter sp.]|jgi:hypothetical protein|nr:hypothetical protein [Ferruginibacter sp.]